MSIVNQLTNSNIRRDRLINNRNGFTYGANMVVLLIALFLFVRITDPINEFRYLTYSVLGLGFFSNVFFLCTINEVKLSGVVAKYE